MLNNELSNTLAKTISTKIESRLFNGIFTFNNLCGVVGYYFFFSFFFVRHIYEPVFKKHMRFKDLIIISELDCVVYIFT